MSSLIIGTAPAGLDLTENRTPSNNATVAVVMGIATFFVAVRFYSRCMNTGTGLGADDWMTLLSLVWTTHAETKHQIADGVARFLHMVQVYVVYWVSTLISFPKESKRRLISFLRWSLRHWKAHMVCS